MIQKISVEGTPKISHNYISKEKIEELVKKYKPNQSNTFIESQERYIKLFKELEDLLGE